MDLEIASWIGYFNYDGGRLMNAFSAAAFLANRNWVESNVPFGYEKSLTVSYGLGEDTVVLSISVGGVVVISVLLGVYLAALTAVAVYASRFPRWTQRLNGFALMRIGAIKEVTGRLPLRVGMNADLIGALDELLGWVGDGAEDGGMGWLGLEARRRLDGKSRYLCYDGDQEYTLTKLISSKGSSSMVELQSLAPPDSMGASRILDLFDIAP